jgi:hypothetical protein
MASALATPAAAAAPRRAAPAPPRAAPRPARPARAAAAAARAVHPDPSKPLYPGFQEEKDVSHEAFMHAMEAARPRAMRLPGMQEFAASLWGRRSIPSQNYSDPLDHIFTEVRAAGVRRAAAAGSRMRRPRRRPGCKEVDRAGFERRKAGRLPRPLCPVPGLNPAWLAAPPPPHPPSLTPTTTAS